MISVLKLIMRDSQDTKIFRRLFIDMAKTYGELKFLHALSKESDVALSRIQDWLGLGVAPSSGIQKKLLRALRDLKDEPGDIKTVVLASQPVAKEPPKLQPPVGRDSVEILVARLKSRSDSPIL